MDKNILEQYIELKEEIQDLHDRIDRDQRRLNRIDEEGLVSDTVKGTRKDGTLGPIKITGYPIPEYNQVKNMIKKRVAKLHILEDELQETVNAKRKKKTISKFYNVRKTRKNADIYELTLQDGTCIKMTADHLLYTQRGWVALKNLKSDDKIVKITPFREIVQQNHVSIVGIKYIGKADVYNMEVKNHHNFSVCGGFIIHNCCDALRYACMTAWRYIKQWLPVEIEEKEYIVDIARKGDEEDGYI